MSGIDDVIEMALEAATEIQLLIASNLFENGAEG
jgi:hypothetical protein